MIKVCHITSVHSSSDVRIFHKECTSLANAGYKVYLVAPGDSYEKDGVQIVGMGDKPTSRMVRMSVWAYRIYKKALSLDAEVYHFHDPELLPYGWLLKRKGKKVIFDSHETYVRQILVKTWLPKLVRNIMAKMYNTMETAICQRLDAVIDVGQDDLQYSFQNRSKCTISIANYPLLSDFPNTDQARFTEPAACYIGGLTESRGITHLIRAANKANIRLYLAGEFSSEGYRAALEALPEYDCVEYVGFLNRVQVAQLLSRVSIGCFTLLKIGQYATMTSFGVKTLEYMAAGLPLIASNISFHKRMFEEEINCGICVEPDNITEIASAMTFLLNNPDKARAMGANGRRAVLEKYNWAAEEKKLLQLYQEILRA